MKTLLAVAALFTFSADSPGAEKKAAKSKSPAKTQEEQFSVAVKELPRDWEKRVASKKREERKRLGEVLTMCAESGGIDADDLDFLRRHREEAIPALQAEIVDDWQAGAVLETLMEIGAPGVRERWFAEFRKGDSKTRATLLQIEAMDEDWRSITAPRSKEEAALFQDALKPGPGFTLGVAFKLEDLSAVASSLLDQMPKLSRSEQWQLAGRLSEGPIAAADAGRLLRWVRELQKKEEDELAKALEVALKIRALGGETAAEAEKLFAELDARDPQELMQMRSRHVVYEFCAIAGLASRPLFERLYKDASESSIRDAAFVGLARLRGPEVLAELDAPARSGENETMVWSVLGALAENGAREQADAWVLKHFPKLSGSGVFYAMHHGAPEVAKRLLAQSTDGEPLDRSDQFQRFELRWRADGITLPSFFERLRERGLIARVPTAAEFDRAKKLRSSIDSEAKDIIRLLGDVGTLLALLPSWDVQPPLYEPVIHRFAAFSRGAFAPGAIRQTAERAELPWATVEFGAAGKYFVLRTRSLGREYDLEGVQAAANRALELAGKKERFMAISTEFQPIAYIYGPAEGWKQIAAEYSLPLFGFPAASAPPAKAAGKARK